MTRKILCVACAMLVAISNSWADQVFMKNGRVVYGRVKNRMGDILWVDVRVGSSEGAVGLNINDVTFVYDNTGKISKFSPQSQEEFVAGLTDKLVEAIAKLRHLEVKSKIQSDILTPEEIKQHMLKQLQKEMPEQEIASMEKILKRLKLAKPDFDYVQSAKEFATNDIAGFYDDIDKKMYISAGVPEKMRFIVVPHETVHALQDQNFDLQKFLPRDIQNLDLELARMCLAEGDAEVTSTDYLLHQRGGDVRTLPDIHSLMKDTIEVMIKQNPAFQKYPTFLREITMFPYLQGPSFVQKTLQNYSYDKLNEIFRDPPGSTEQIIHPEKYFFQRDDPVNIEFTFNKPLGDAWKELCRDTWGEYVVYHFLKAYTNLIEAKMASEGWGGDKILAYENQQTKEVAIIWLTVWDTEKDAGEFFNAYPATIKARYPELKDINTNQKDSLAWDTPQGKVCITKSGKAVLISEGIPIEDNSLANRITINLPQPQNQ